jgi:hypothetical protein
MKRSAVYLALIVALLSLAGMGFHGCGHGNTLTSITVTPADPIITKSTTTQTTHQFYATAHFSDGLTVVAWSQVKWQSSDPTVLAITNTGVATAYKAGTAVITAVDIAHPTITGWAEYFVVELESITIFPAEVSIPAGTVLQFSATGAYSAVSPTTASTDLTRLVTWSTASTAIATIGNILGTQGMATAVSAGTTTITARDPSTGIVSSGTTTLTVF